MAHLLRQELCHFFYIFSHQNVTLPYFDFRTLFALTAFQQLVAPIYHCLVGSYSFEESMFVILSAFFKSC
jgi:hypothetical protein